MHRDALPLPTRRGFLGAAVATTRLAAGIDSPQANWSAEAHGNSE